MSQRDEISTTLLEFDKVEPITYQNAYVAFIDILGFRQIILSGDIEKVSLYHSIVKHVVHKKLKLALEFGGQYNIQVMSDSIVIAVTPDSKDDIIIGHIKSFRALSVAVAALQFELVLNNFWMRGGISFGPIAFMEKNFVVGPALVNSYLLENEKAKVPRVIVDPSVPGILKMGEDQFIDAITQTKSPGVVYPWILGKNSVPGTKFNEYIFVHSFYFFEQEWDFVNQAAETISRHLKECIGAGNEHAEKYKWVAQYINSLKMPRTVRSHFRWLDTLELNTTIL